MTPSAAAASVAPVSPAKSAAEILEIDGHEVRVSSPDKVVFPEPGLTKLDLVRVLPRRRRRRAARRRAAGRWCSSASSRASTQEAFFQKRVPENHPDFIDTATLHYARGTSAEEAVVRDAAGLAWVVNLGCLDLNPHPVRAEDLDHPDELRIDLDPMPGVDWSQIVDVAMVAREVLDDHGLVGWPKTRGSRGLHILVRIAPQWDFKQVRLAAETLAREVENRAPGLATARWWKEERGESVFVDFNQNAKDRTVASAYSVRPLPDARVSTPLDWDEVRGLPARGVHGAARCCERFAEHRRPAGRHRRRRRDRSTRLLRLAERARPGREAAPRRRRPAGARRRCRSSRSPAPRPSPRRSDALERWKARHPDVAALLHPADVLVDGMRGLELALVPRAGQPAARARGGAARRRRS